MAVIQQGIGSDGNQGGDVTLAPVGSSPNANAATITGQTLALQPADGTNPGVVSTSAQTFGGAKTFSAPGTFSNQLTASVGLLSNGPAVISSVTSSQGLDVSGVATGVPAITLRDGNRVALTTAQNRYISFEGGAYMLPTDPVSATQFQGSAAAGSNSFRITTAGSRLALRLNGAAISTGATAPLSGAVVLDSVVPLLAATERIASFQNAGQEVAAIGPSGSLMQSSFSSVTGSSTCNCPLGRNVIVAGGVAARVINSLVTTGSFICVSPESFDTTLVKWKVDPQAGFFDVSGSAAATANWQFSWHVNNPR